jgi:hypothetical protein
MRGVVACQAAKNGCIVIQMEDKSYSVLAHATGCFEVGDEVSGELQYIGFKGAFNETQKRPTDSVVDDCYCSRDRAFLLLRNA